MTATEQASRALNRHARGWAIVQWIACPIYARDMVIVNDGGEIYPAMRRDLRALATLPRKTKQSLGII